VFIEELERFERKQAFIEKAILKYDNKFDYSKVVYIDSITKVTIICNRHKIEFQQKPNKHLQNKHSCLLCTKEAYSKAVRISKKDFIKQANKIHSNIFSYEKAIPKNKHDKIVIYCKKHKKYFEQRLNTHLKGYVGCKECIKEEKIKRNREQFKQKFIDTFIDKFGKNYDFSKVEYINNNTPVKVYCRKHKVLFSQVHRNIRRSKTCSCPKCKKEKLI